MLKLQKDNHGSVTTLQLSVRWDAENSAECTYNVSDLVALVARLGLSLHAALSRDVTLLTAVCNQNELLGDFCLENRYADKMNVL